MGENPKLTLSDAARLVEDFYGRPRPPDPDTDPDDLVTVRRGDLRRLFAGYGDDCPAYDSTDPWYRRLEEVAYPS